MEIDVSSFCLQNVTDTCAVWNVLSSKVLYSVACYTGCSFCMTYFVQYECLFKPRKTIVEEDTKLQKRLRMEQQKGHFKAYRLDIPDLQDVGILENRKKLSKGELTSIAFAKKTNQAFLTDDTQAKKLARNTLDFKNVQTTPHLFGWLFFKRKLSDSDKSKIISEHNKFKRPLQRYFEIMYGEALRCISLTQSKSS